MRKTMHLSMVEDGAYTRLLDWYYANDRAIPHDRRYAVARAANAAEKSAVDAVLREFFTLVGDAHHHERADLEIAKAAPKISAAKANGKLGGRPKGSKSGTHKKPSGFSEQNPERTHSESSPEPELEDSLRSSTPPTPSKGELAGFVRFWSAWPSNPRKVAKAQCLAKWQSKQLEGIADRIVAHVEAMAKTEKWREKGGEFVPSPLVYLNQSRWEAPTEFAEPASTAASSAVDETQAYLAQIAEETRLAREANERRRAARLAQESGGVEA